MKAELTDLKESINHPLNRPIETESESDDSEEITLVKTLLIGDSIIRDINQNDLPDTVATKLPGRTIKDIGEYLQTVDMSPYKKMIIHGGTNNVARGMSTHCIVEEMETLVTNIQIKAPRCSVFISGLCSRPDRHEVEQIQALVKTNLHLQELARKLDCKFIDNDTAFRLINGDIDVNSFIDHVHLSPNGTLKLTENILTAVFDIKKHVAPCAVITQRQNALPISKVLELYPHHPKHPDDHQISSTSRYSYYGRRDTPGRDRMHANHQQSPTSRSSYRDRRGPPRRDPNLQQ